MIPKREGEGVRGWERVREGEDTVAGVEDEIHSGVSAAFRVRSLGHWVKSTRLHRERREKARTKGTSSHIRVHNANFNLSRRRRRHCHHPSSLFDARLFLERAAPSTRETREWKDDELKAERREREGGTGWSERREWKGYKVTVTSRRPSSPRVSNGLSEDERHLSI